MILLLYVILSIVYIIKKIKQHHSNKNIGITTGVLFMMPFFYTLFLSMFFTAELYEYSKSNILPLDTNNNMICIDLDLPTIIFTVKTEDGNININSNDLIICDSDELDKDCLYFTKFGIDTYLLYPFFDLMTSNGLDEKFILNLKTNKFSINLHSIQSINNNEFDTQLVIN